MKILILFGHPAFQRSNVNKWLVNGLEYLDNITFHDLYEAYPELDIDIDAEQKLAEAHDCIVFMHPMYWYSSPAIFKEWQDLVLEYGWAYGKEGNALTGKYFFTAITTGAAALAFNPGEFQEHTVPEFLLPFRQMARLCSMITLPPFVVYGTHSTTKERLRTAQRDFHNVLELLCNNKVDLLEVAELKYLNNILKNQ